MRDMDPILASIIENYKLNPVPNMDGMDDEIGDFTNRIIMSKEEDIRYFLRMVVTRLDNEFGLLPTTDG
jgi:hypothetical protein